MRQRRILHQPEHQERAIRVHVPDRERPRRSTGRVDQAQLREAVPLVVQRLAELVAIEQRHVRVRVAHDRHARADLGERAQDDARGPDRARADHERARAMRLDGAGIDIARRDFDMISALRELRHQLARDEREASTTRAARRRSSAAGTRSCRHRSRNPCPSSASPRGRAGGCGQHREARVTEVEAAPRHARRAWLIAARIASAVVVGVRGRLQRRELAEERHQIIALAVDADARGDPVVVRLQIGKPDREALEVRPDERWRTRTPRPGEAALGEGVQRKERARRDRLQAIGIAIDELARRRQLRTGALVLEADALEVLAEQVAMLLGIGAPQLVERALGRLRTSRCGCRRRACARCALLRPSPWPR